MKAGVISWIAGVAALGLLGCSSAPGSEPGPGDGDSGAWPVADSGPAADHESPPPDAGDPDAQPMADSGPDAGLPPGMLDTTIVAQVVEPEGGGKDDASHSFTDKNYWNFCVPGAAAVALHYWLPKALSQWPAGDFKEPQNAPSTIPAAGTYWKSDENVNGYHTYGRAYVMYLAMQVKPPNYSMAGIASFAQYPSTGSTLADARDAMNWEASGHAANYQQFGFTVVGAANMTAQRLHDDIKKMIDGGHAVVVAADTAYMPNWSRSLSHAITVVGYDDSKVTYKYTDTCGVHCNGSNNSKNGGVWTIAQSKLYDGIKADSGGYIIAK